MSNGAKATDLRCTETNLRKNRAFYEKRGTRTDASQDAASMHGCSSDCENRFGRGCERSPSRAFEREWDGTHALAHACRLCESR